MSIFNTYNELQIRVNKKRPFMKKLLPIYSSKGVYRGINELKSTSNKSSKSSGTGGDKIDELKDVENKVIYLVT